MNATGESERGRWTERRAGARRSVEGERERAEVKQESIDATFRVRDSTRRQADSAATTGPFRERAARNFARRGKFPPPNFIRGARDARVRAVSAW